MYSEQNAHLSKAVVIRHVSQVILVARIRSLDVLHKLNIKERIISRNILGYLITKPNWGGEGLKQAKSASGRRVE